MKYFLLVGLTLLTLAVAAQAQNLYGGGLSFGAIVGNGFNGQNNSIGGFGEGTYSRKFGIRFDATGLVTLEHSPKDGTTGGIDVRVRPELRAFAPKLGPVQAFAGGGVQYSYFNSDQYGKSGLNVLGTIGAEIYGKHTVRGSRLFTDRTNFNENRLEGVRYGYDLTQRLPESTWAIRFSAEYNRFQYVQPFGQFMGGYDGQSLTFRLGLVKTH